jgi:hypothetical protein
VEGREASFEAESKARYLPRILARLVRSGMPQSVLLALQDDDASIRAIFAKALGMSGNPAAVPALEKLKDDLDPGVRRAAQDAVALLGPLVP